MDYLSSLNYWQSNDLFIKTQFSETAVIVRMILYDPNSHAKMPSVASFCFNNGLYKDYGVVLFAWHDDRHFVFEVIKLVSLELTMF